MRVRYAKTGKVRFISAIDLGRIWERSLRKADLPIAYSEGFTPHPKVSFTDALPLGLASQGEYAELTFAGPLAPDLVIARLNAAFPEGIAVLDAVAVPDGEARFARRLQASMWDLNYPATVDAAALAAAVADAVAAQHLPVTRERKGVPESVDARPAIHLLTASDHTVRAVLHHAETLPPGAASVRPAEIDAALRLSLRALPAPIHLLRVAQGIPTADGLLEALSGELVPAAARATIGSHQ